jgi:hypothetical protein
VTEPPEQRACRTQTTPERRGVESVLRLWRLGDSNRRNVYVGNEHVGVFFNPELADEVVRRMNAEAVRTTAERHTQTGPASTESAEKARGGVVDTKGAESRSAGRPGDSTVGAHPRVNQPPGNQRYGTIPS